MRFDVSWIVFTFLLCLIALILYYWLCCFVVWLCGSVTYFLVISDLLVTDVLVRFDLLFGFAGLVVWCWFGVCVISID